MSTPSTSFEIKSAQLPLVALMLKTSDWKLVQQELEKKFGPSGESPDFFDNDALVIDFAQVRSEEPLHDLVPLLKTLRQCRLMPVAVRNANDMWMQKALAVGLVQAEPEVQRSKTPVKSLVPETPATPPQPEKAVEVAVAATKTMVIDKPLRSGQKIYAKGSDLVVLAMVNPGAEVVADGNIHVYATLRGKAMAGARGNTQARIFALAMEPELISIAGVYRTSENPLPPAIHGKTAQVRLSDDGQEKLLFDALKP